MLTNNKNDSFIYLDTNLCLDIYSLLYLLFQDIKNYNTFDDRCCHFIS